MNNQPTPWVDPADQQLTELLAAAGAPGTDAELRNEERSVAMFHMAHVESLNARREFVSPTPRTKRFAARTLAAGIAAFALATAGIALAASGNLPGNGQATGFGNDDDQGSSQVAESESLDQDEQGEDEQLEDEQGEESSDEVTNETEVEDSNSPTEETDESTSQAYRGLCRAITVGNKAEHGKALEAPPFVGLMEAAGGIENVKTYCTELLGTSPTTGERPEKPAKADHPTKPTHPGKPDEGDHPDKPAKPDHEKPDHEKKDHPEKP